MAKKILTEEAVANAIYEKFSKENLREKWHDFIKSGRDTDINNVEEYICSIEKDISDWLETLIPYIPYQSVIDDVIEDYFRKDYYREDVVKEIDMASVSRKKA